MIYPKKSLKLVLFFATTFFHLAGTVFADSPATDMNFKYEGSILLFSTKPKFEEYSILEQHWYSDQLPDKKPITPVGEFTRKMYEVPVNSSLEAVYTYEKQLTDMGFTIIGKYKNNDADWFVRKHICKNETCGSLRKVGNDLYVELVKEQTIIARKSSTEGDYVVVVAAGEIKTDLGITPPLGSVNATGNPAPPHQLTHDNVLLMVDTIFPKTIEKKVVKEDLTYIQNKLVTEGKVDLYGILFDYDKADIKSESAQTLEQIAEVLKSDLNLKLSIIGHTDNQGTEEYNQKLSEARAKAVMHYLALKHDIGIDRLEAVGKGLSDPVASNETEEGRARNRRVELKKMENIKYAG